MRRALPLLALYTLFTISCKPTPASKAQMEQEPANPTQTEQPAAPALAEIPAEAPRLSNQAYDYQVFLPLFPQIVSYSGLQTSSGENYRMGAGIVATATGSYSHQDRRFSVVIHDVGNNQELLADLAKWNGTVANEDTETQYAKTWLWDNKHPAVTTYDKPRRMGSISVILHNRFVVDISGRNIELADLDKALQDMHLERLK